MKAFYCDGNIFCGKCYLEMLNESEYMNLIVSFTKIIDVENDFKCDNCKKLCSSMESLNSMKYIVKKLEKEKNG